MLQGQTSVSVPDREMRSLIKKLLKTPKVKNTYGESVI